MFLLTYSSFYLDHLQVKIGGISPTELRDTCEKGLLLITVTIPEMEVYECLWLIILSLNSLLFIILYANCFQNSNRILCLIFPACTLAIFAENDHTTDIYWSCCHGRILSQDSTDLVSLSAGV